MKQEDGAVDTSDGTAEVQLYGGPSTARPPP